MKFLTLRQPWASLIAEDLKTIETRGYSTSYRGPVAIHAGKSTDSLCHGEHHGPFRVQNWDDTGWHLYDYRGHGHRVDLPFGVVVAVADLVDVVPIIDDEEDPFDRYPCVQSMLGSDDFPDGWLELYHPTLGNPVAPEFGRSIPEEASFGDYAPGRYAWLLANVRRLPEPVPMKGALGLRDVPADVLPLILEQLERAS